MGVMLGCLGIHQDLLPKRALKGLLSLKRGLHGCPFEGGSETFGFETLCMVFSWVKGI